MEEVVSKRKLQTADWGTVPWVNGNFSLGIVYIWSIFWEHRTERAVWNSYWIPLLLQKLTSVEAAAFWVFLIGTNQACKNCMPGNVVCGRNRSNIKTLIVSAGQCIDGISFLSSSWWNCTSKPQISHLHFSFTRRKTDEEEGQYPLVQDVKETQAIGSA